MYSLLLVAFANVLPSQAQADGHDLKFSPIFMNNMVLQRQEPVRITGLAAPQEGVEVFLGMGSSAFLGNARSFYYQQVDRRFFCTLLHLVTRTASA